MKKKNESTGILTHTHTHTYTHTPPGILIYPTCSALDVHKRVKCTKYESNKKGKDQESIQPSTTPDQGYQWESNKLTIRHHKREPSR